MSRAWATALRLFLTLNLALSLGLATHWHRFSQSPLFPTSVPLVAGAFPVLSTVDVVDRLRQGDTLIIDARPEASYQFRHIPGAINLPPGTSLGTSQSDDVRAAKRVVVYCGGIECDASLQLARSLQLEGLRDIAVYEGGFEAWLQAGMPTQ